MIPKKYLFTKTGQSFLEYATIFMLVGIGVLVMGPYVIRSWNANLRTWETTSRESSQEVLRQMPLDNTLIDTTVCVCEPFEDQGCGLGGPEGPGSKLCGPLEMLSTRDCDPFGCGPSVGITVADCENREGCCEDIELGCGTPCGTNEMHITHRCFNLPDEARCISDDSCIFQCNGALSAATWIAELCPFDGDDLLDGNTDYTYVSAGDCSQPDGSLPKCEVECHEENGFSLLDSAGDLCMSSGCLGCGCLTESERLSQDGFTCECNRPRFYPLEDCPVGMYPRGAFCDQEQNVLNDVCGDKVVDGSCSCGPVFFEDTMAAAEHCEDKSEYLIFQTCADPVTVIKAIVAVPDPDGAGPGLPQCTGTFKDKGIDPVTGFRYCVDYTEACADVGLQPVVTCLFGYPEVDGIGGFLCETNYHPKCVGLEIDVIEDIELEYGDMAGNHAPLCSSLGSGWTEYLYYDLTDGTRTAAPAIRFCKKKITICTDTIS